MTEVRTSRPQTSADTRVRTAVAVGIGNFMEWFDFAIYGFFAVLIGQMFFPANADPIVASLSSLSVFAVGFLMRPLGAFILGPIGDKYGRRTSLVASVMIMGAATFLMGLLPSYATIGIAAPILLVLLRCVQGLAAGGEWSGSAAYLVESAPDHRRGLFASLISGTAALAFIVGSFVALWINSALDPEAVAAWGWRIPFLLALPMALIGLYIRLKLGDTPVFTALKANHQVAESPLKASGNKKNIYAILLTFAFSSVSGLGIYYLATYMNNHFTTALGVERVNALLFSGIGLLLYLLMCPHRRNHFRPVRPPVAEHHRHHRLRRTRRPLLPPLRNGQRGTDRARRGRDRRLSGAVLRNQRRAAGRTVPRLHPFVGKRPRI